jgi:hypothetical protein
MPKKKTTDLPPKEKGASIPQQPRPLDEEEALKRKYAAIDDLEERAYQILVDLGMV